MGQFFAAEASADTVTAARVPAWMLQTHAREPRGDLPATHRGLSHRVAAGAALTATGGAAAPAIAAALGAAGAGGGIAGYLDRRVHSARAEQLERDVRIGGIALWVRTPDAASEEKAMRILAEQGARDIHVESIGPR